jgi:hypothetical protein
MKVKEALKTLSLLDENDDITVNIADKSDIEFDLGYEVTKEQWLAFIETYETDEQLNEQRALAWQDALQVIRDEVEG